LKRHLSCFRITPVRDELAGWLRLLDKRSGFDRFRCFSREINILGVVPEPPSSGRYQHGESAPQPLAGVGEGGATGAELRLWVLQSLPQMHLRYLFEEIRNRCRDYLRKKRVPASELTPEELISEVWQKLFGSVALDNDEPQKVPSALPSEWSINPNIPEQDGRVVWLINEIGGYEAIGHRCEDVKRQRYGKAVPGRGRRIVQPKDDQQFEPEQKRYEDHTSPYSGKYRPDFPGPFQASLREVDSRLVWSGLLATASLQFQRHDDVSMLLRLMADVPDILEDSTGDRWPVQIMVTLLNQRFPPPSWNGERVDNAKRRLVNWIKRLMRKNGLDTTDLEALFARVGRQLEQGNRRPRLETSAANLLS
jgi:hypothetical protein